MKFSVSCPLGKEIINENVVRIVAAFVVKFTLISILFPNPFTIGLLFIDFASRSIFHGKLSLFKMLSIKIVTFCRIDFKATNAEAKRFSAYIGLLFSGAILLAHLFSQESLFYLISSILIFCAALESIFSYCLGCEFYSLIRYFKNKLNLVQ